MHVFRLYIEPEGRSMQITLKVIYQGQTSHAYNQFWRTQMLSSCMKFWLRSFFVSYWQMDKHTLLTSIPASMFTRDSQMRQTDKHYRSRCRAEQHCAANNWLESSSYGCVASDASRRVIRDRVDNGHFSTAHNHSSRFLLLQVQSAIWHEWSELAKCTKLRIHFRPHRMHKVRTIAIDGSVAWASVILSVSLTVYLSCGRLFLIIHQMASRCDHYYIINYKAEIQRTGSRSSHYIVYMYFISFFISDVHS